MKYAGTRVDITPPVGLPMGGNVRDDDRSRGIHDNLYCDIILIESNGETVCFLDMDLLGLLSEQCRMIKAKVSEASGLSPDKILLSATHTHSGPDVMAIFKDSKNEGCIRYLEDAAAKIAVSAGMLNGSLEEVKIGFSQKQVYGLSFNRRLIMKNGSMRMNWEDVGIEDVEREAGPVDPELSVLTIYDMDGRIKAAMINFTLHPAVLVGKDWLWSKDYINYLEEYIKANIGNDVHILFTNGAEGNVNHINFRDKNQGRGFEEARRIGMELGRHVVECICNSEMLEEDTLKCLTEKIELPLRTISEEDIRKAGELLAERGDEIPSLLDGVPDEIYAREIIKLGKITNKDVQTEIQTVKIGNIAIATLPGEVFVEFGLKIKQQSGFRNTMIFGLTNGCEGYIPTYEAFSEGGYEVKTAESSKLDKTAGDKLAADVIALLKKL